MMTAPGTVERPMSGLKGLYYCRRCKVYFTVDMAECPQHHGLDQIQRIKEMK